MKHGWTEHGAPCCGKAPVIERPDEVTACGGPFACATCAGRSIALHLDGMQVPNIFDEAAWRLRQDVRFVYQGMTYAGTFTGPYAQYVAQLLTGGITP